MRRSKLNHAVRWGWIDDAREVSGSGRPRWCVSRWSGCRRDASLRARHFKSKMTDFTSGFPTTRWKRWTRVRGSLLCFVFLLEVVVVTGDPR